MRRLAALVATFALAAPAAAGTLESPPLVGGASSTMLVRCAITNVGKKPLAIESVAIVSFDAPAELTLSVDTCTPGPLAPRASCIFRIDAGVPGGFGTISFRGSARNVRGLCQLVETVDQSIVSESEMR